MRPDREGFPVARVCLHAGEIGLARRLGAPTAHGRRRDGPWQDGRAHRGPRGALVRPRGCPGTRAEAAGGHERVPAGEARDVLDGIEPPHAQDRAAPGERPSPSARGAGGRLRRCEEAPLHGAEPRVVVVQQRAIHVEARVDGRLGNPRRHTLPVRVANPLDWLLEVI
jgi:hypothetical protein